MFYIAPFAKIGRTWEIHKAKCFDWSRMDCGRWSWCVVQGI